MAIILKQQSPSGVADLSSKSVAAGFGAGPGLQVGALLRCLANTKPGGRFLELDSGCGLATAWILDGMDADSLLVAVENSSQALGLARESLGQDQRLRLENRQPRLVLDEQLEQSIDFLFAGGDEGKFARLHTALGALKPGGFYIANGLIPSEAWDEKKEKQVSNFVEQMEARPDLTLCNLELVGGLLIATKKQ